MPITESVKAGTLPRPGPIGRAVRLLMGVPGLKSTGPDTDPMGGSPGGSSRFGPDEQLHAAAGPDVLLLRRSTPERFRAGIRTWWTTGSFLPGRHRRHLRSSALQGLVGPAVWSAGSCPHDLCARTPWRVVPCRGGISNPRLRDASDSPRDGANIKTDNRRGDMKCPIYPPGQVGRGFEK